MKNVFRAGYQNDRVMIMCCSLGFLDLYSVSDCAVCVRVSLFFLFVVFLLHICWKKLISTKMQVSVKPGNWSFYHHPKQHVTFSQLCCSLCWRKCLTLWLHYCPLIQAGPCWVETILLNINQR